MTVPARYLLLTFFLSITGFIQAQGNSLPADSLSSVERELFSMINEYRAGKGLPVIPLSSSLNYVARTHARDLAENHPNRNACNLHSWSSNGPWTSCCYTPDHRKAACMWNKPSELTAYTGKGYEIAYWTNRPFASAGEYAAVILKGWKGSPGHNALILNLGKWRSTAWKAVGVGVSGEYSCVWFGEEEDSGTGQPEK